MSSQQLLPKTDAEQDELQRERRMNRMLRRKEQRRAKVILWGTIGSSLVLLGLVGFVFLRIQSMLYANTVRPPINGVSCDAVMQSAYHIHAHLTIYSNGKLVTIPQGIGIDSQVGCFYWLHTHTSNGIIHIEAPRKQSNLALDDFLTIWHDGFAKLNFPQELTKQTGWKIFVNGKPFAGQVTSPLNTEVPLNSHDIVTLEYGSPNPRPDDASTYKFPANLKQ